MRKRDQQKSLLFRETKQTVSYRNPIQLHAPHSTAPQSSLLLPAELASAALEPSARRRSGLSIVYKSLNTGRTGRGLRMTPQKAPGSSCNKYQSTSMPPWIGNGLLKTDSAKDCDKKKVHGHCLLAEAWGTRTAPPPVCSPRRAPSVYPVPRRTIE
jgi:hypothetical protein